MKKVRGLKAILASFLVTVALAAPAAVLSSQADEVKAELYFTGVKLEMLSDGTVQAIFEVSVDKVLNCIGATFVLDYNPDYFTPSYIDDATHVRNDIFTPSTNPNDDGFFAYDRTLYKSDTNPFQDVVYLGREWDDATGTMVDRTSKYSTVVLSEHRVIMDLLLDQEKIIKNQSSEEPVGKLALLRGVSYGGTTGSEEQPVYVINKYGLTKRLGDIDKKYDVDPSKLERVALGQLSFRVNPDRLDEIARYFPQPAVKTEIAEKKMDNGDDTYLIRTLASEGISGRDNWQIGVFWRDEGTTDSLSDHYYRDTTSEKDEKRMPGTAKRYYELAVDPKQLMKVRPAEEEVTINAYQAYTDGTWGDIAQALRRYSPMATATYVDGTQENLVIPWGQEEEGYEYTITVKGTDGKFHPIDQPDNYSIYNPLEGVYQITQKIKKADGTFHPVPIKVTLTVTRIKLRQVQVENQVITYDLSDVVDQVDSPSKLKLPDKARLITDIVPSGVSMVMKIPGWTPEKGTWPNEGTGSNPNTLMNALREDSHGPSSVIPEGITEFDQETMPYWPDGDDIAAISKGEYWRFLKQKNKNWIGEYTFHMAKSYGGEVTNGFTKGEIQEAFPWLTVEEDFYQVPDARRQIVTKSSLNNEGKRYTASYVSTVVADNGQPELTLSVQRSDQTVMKEGSIFRVWLPNGLELGNDQNIAVWPEDYHATTNIPQGNWFPETVVDGKTVKNGDYHTEKKDEAGNNRFHLVTNPGDPTTGASKDERETLRRYINLGGWYQVTVCEDPETKTWSDPIPVYVPPRPNEYQSDKEYNFVAENAELFHWPGGLTHYVTMPQGTYTAVTKNGARLYDVGDEVLTVAEIKAKAAAQASDPDAMPRYGDYLDDKDRPKSILQRHEEFYGYHTTYDGSTGAQPGTLYSFQVGPVPDPEPAPGEVRNTPWREVEETFSYDASAITAGTKIFRYGSDDDPAKLDPFYDGAVYPAYGTVTQPANTRPTESQPASAEPYEVTVRRDNVQNIEGGYERITLTSDSPFGITRVDNSDLDSRVTLATYDTRTVNYTDRQEYTFTITNVGTLPIYGLAIDGLTDGYAADSTGGRFEMVQPPASFLAPGQSTTFVLTYVYNLEANKAPGPNFYRDTLYITSSNHPTAKKGGTNQETPGTDGKYDYLLDFDAEFKVTDKDTHTVIVEVKPNDRNMGDAGLIVGEQEDGTVMNYTVTTRSYYADERVYVAVYKKDEYKLWKTPPLAEDAAGNPILLERYTNPAITIPDNIEIYYFTIRNYDTTVTVQFYEDIRSKLRLSDLIDFSAGTEAELKSETNKVVADDNTYTVWRKSYTKEERDDAKNWHNNRAQKPEEELYLATKGTVIKGEEGNQFIDTEDQYIVVIPWDADYSQVQVTLRNVKIHAPYDGTPDGRGEEAINEEIEADVTMYHYDWGFEADWPTDPNAERNDDTLKVNPVKGYTADREVATDPGTPTSHYSDPFDSPAEGTSDYVRITVTYENETSRSYYLEIHRAPRYPEATLHYGNSPYGMIMNDTQFHRSTPEKTKEAQDDAKKDFRENGYTFNGLLDLGIPHVVREAVGSTGKPAVSQKAVYWREAWVHNNQLFEPESLTGFTITYPSPTAAPTPTPTATPTPDPGATPGPSPTPAPNANQFEPVTAPDPAVYKEEENLDLNDYAYFAILGENMREPGIVKALDSTGRPVNLEDIHVRATVTLLDNDATTQIGRFSGTKTATLDLGNLDKTTGGRGKQLTWLPEPAVMNAGQAGKWNVSSVTTVDPTTGEKNTTYTQVEHIRPGQYVLEYVYGDYDGKLLSVTRPFVILSSVGDVNCDGGAVNGDDEKVLKNRVADPLGYVAGRWEWVQVETSPEKWEWKETVYPRSNIFKYRVVDVNNDRNVNNIDGNLINKITRGKAEAIRFYNPIYYTYPST